MNNTTKTTPTHRVTFTDAITQTPNSEALAAGVVWPRKGGKQGGILKWDISPEILGEGLYRLVVNDGHNSATEQDTPTTYTISFSQQQKDNTNPSKLGRSCESSDG